MNYIVLQAWKSYTPYKLDCGLFYVGDCDCDCDCDCDYDCDCELCPQDVLDVHHYVVLRHVAPVEQSILNDGVSIFFDKISISTRIFML